MLKVGEFRTWIFPAVLIGSVFLMIGAIATYSRSLPIYWSLTSLQDFVVWLAICMLAGVLWRYVSAGRAHELFLCSVTTYIVIGAGLVESSAVVFFLISAFVAGRVCLDLFCRYGAVNPDGTSCLMVGLALYLAAFGLLLHFPINYRSGYYLILFIPVISALVLKRGRVMSMMLGQGLSQRFEPLRKVSYGAFVVMIGLLGYVARFALFPSVGYDDNAQHLRIWSQLLHERQYSFDVSVQIWELAPFAVDLLHGVVSVLAGSDARSALNVSLLTIVLYQMWRLSEVFNVKCFDRLLIVSLFASTPLVGNLLTNLQTELFLAVLAVSGARLILVCKQAHDGSIVIGLLSVAALCCATKLPGVVLGATIIIATMACLYKSTAFRFESVSFGGVTKVGVLCVVLAFAAFHSYLYAWYISGNPFFPLYNAIFKSPYFAPVNFSDLRYVKGVGFESYWNVFFKTGEFFESRDFVAGFQYLFLFPISLIMVVWRRILSLVWPILVPLVGFGLAMFSVTQYWRYVFPVLPLAGVSIASLLRDESGVLGLRRIVIGRCVVGMFAVVNLYFFPGVSWFFNTDLQRAYTEGGRRSLTEELAPVKALTAYVNEHFQGGRVLYPEAAPYGATLNGHPIYVNWYAPKNAGRLAGWRGDDDVAAFVEEERVEFAISDLASQSRPGDPSWLLREYLSRNGVPEYQIGANVLYRIVGRDIAYREVFNLNDAVEHGTAPVTGIPHVLGSLKTGNARAARYTATVRCQGGGQFVAQVNWNVGAPYYRLVPCTAEAVTFVEAVRIPHGASYGEIVVTTQGGTDGWVSKLSIEAN